ncbi:MAG: hypothetical protein OEU09_10290 [Rhodospirillales bacterium]|nr:hypothetical protein [Rhodospirillales bacterium]MDH3911678.1 hypothetical protein [Rhodospirillales bacterium]MDH3968751.1 hypothetical protein [Rhodospirillales bacterium]
MNKGLKIGGGVAAVLIVVLAVVFYFVFTSLGSLIVAAVEGFGSEATQAEVELKDAEVSVTSGEGALRGLRVGNPKGFATDSAVWLGHVSLKLDVTTITSDPVVIKEIVVQAPEVTYELGAAGSNIDALKRNVESYAKQMSGGGQGTGGGGGDAGAEGPKLIIENLYVRDGTVNVSASALGGKTLSVPLPAVHLKNIGKDTGGATPDEIMAAVFSSVSGTVGKAVSPLALDKLTGAAESGAAGAKGALEKGAKDAGDTLKKLLGD